MDGLGKRDIDLLYTGGHLPKLQSVSDFVRAVSVNCVYLCQFIDFLEASVQKGSDRSRGEPLFHRSRVYPTDQEWIVGKTPYPNIVTVHEMISFFVLPVIFL